MNEKKKRNPIVLVIEILLLVVLAVALVYVVYSSMQANDELNKPAPTPTPTAAPTPTPTPEPTPTPVGLPDFEPHAVEGTEPENLIKSTDYTVFSDAFTFALLIVILVFKPTGLFGEKTTDKV